MNISIGGLFKKQEQADEAYAALRQAGFTTDEITMWVQRKDVPLKSERRVSIMDIGISAGIGAVIVGILAAGIGLLISLGGIDVPGFRPDFSRGPYVESVAFGLFVVQGAITGAILGAAIRLLTSRRDARITTRGIRRGGVLVVVKAAEDRQEVVKRVLREHDAADVKNLTEKWASSVWAGLKEIQPSAGS